MRHGIAVLAAVAFVAAGAVFLVVPGQDSESGRDRQSPHATVDGSGKAQAAQVEERLEAPDLEVLRNVEQWIASNREQADQTGLVGSGGIATVYTSQGAPVRGFEVARARLFRTGYLGAEPTLGVTAEGSVFVQGVQLTSPTPTLGGIVLRSSDGGRSWTDVSPRAAGVYTHANSEDPYLHVDPVTGSVFTSDLQTTNCQLISRSDDGGLTWSNSLNNCEQADHQTVFTGTPRTSQTDRYPRIVYNCAINGGATVDASIATTCARSLDGGHTFTLTRTPPYPAGINTDPGQEGVPGKCGGASGHGFVDQKGVIYLPRGWCGQPWLAISTDEGDTWRRVQIADNGMFTGPVFPDAPVDTQADESSVVADQRGNLYYFWVARDRRPHLAISRDGGRTWTNPVDISPRGLTQAALPALAIGPDGKLAFAYMGSGNAPGEPFPSQANAYDNTTWNGYLTVTPNPLAKQPTFITAPVNDPADPLVKGVCGPIRCQAEFDFIDVQIDSAGKPWASFVDGCISGHRCQVVGETVVGTLHDGTP